MAEYSGVTQTVQPGESIIYTITNVPCSRGLILHDNSTGNFLLRGVLQNGNYTNTNGCRRCNARNSLYQVTVGANIAIAEGGTADEISIAIAVDGGTLSNTTMRVTPAAVGDFFNVSRSTNVEIFNGCCQTVTVKNTGTQAIEVSEPNITFSVA